MSDLPFRSTKPRRRALAAVWPFVTTALLLAVVAGLAGYALRDRTIVSQLLMFIPLTAVSAALAGWTAIRRGMARGRRTGTLGIALTGLALGLSESVGWQAPAAVPARAKPVTLVQWNVLWGGMNVPRDWPTAISKIVAARPDLVVLSESPDAARVDTLCQALGPAWRQAAWENTPRERYSFDLTVIAPAPLAIERQDDITGGKALTVKIGAGLRVLVIDGLSGPTTPRLPRTNDVARLLNAATARDEPVDVVAGDFNTPARSLGFDAVEAADFDLASRRARGRWRGSWPVWLPLWDIDHVFISRRHAVTSADLFSASGFDHRGEIVTFVPDIARTR